MYPVCVYMCVCIHILTFIFNRAEAFKYKKEAKCSPFLHSCSVNSIKLASPEVAHTSTDYIGLPLVLKPHLTTIETGKCTLLF